MTRPGVTTNQFRSTARNKLKGLMEKNEKKHCNMCDITKVICSLRSNRSSVG